MATQNSNGKAKRQNFVSVTLQAAGEGDVKYAASGKPWGKIKAFFSQGKDKQTGEYLPSLWFTVKAFSKTEELEGRWPHCRTSPRATSSRSKAAWAWKSGKVTMVSNTSRT